MRDVFALQYRQGGSERQTQIGAGVAVGDREDVDVVQKVLVGDDAVYAGYQRIGECGAIKVLCDWIRQSCRYSRGNRNVVP